MPGSGYSPAPHYGGGSPYYAPYINPYDGGGSGLGGSGLGGASHADADGKRPGGGDAPKRPAPAADVDIKPSDNANDLAKLFQGRIKKAVMGLKKAGRKVDAAEVAQAVHAAMLAGVNDAKFPAALRNDMQNLAAEEMRALKIATAATPQAVEVAAKELHKVMPELVQIALNRQGGG